MIQTKDQLRAFNTKKHELVKNLDHKKKSIFISTDDVFRENAHYGPKGYWKYVEDEFYLKHGVKVLDREKLVLYTTVLDGTIEVAGHIGFSISEPKS